MYILLFIALLPLAHYIPAAESYKRHSHRLIRHQVSCNASSCLPSCYFPQFIPFRLSNISLSALGVCLCVCPYVDQRHFTKNDIECGKLLRVFLFSFLHLFSLSFTKVSTNQMKYTFFK